MSERNSEEHRLVAGRYRLLETLGSGAMGVVWKGQDQLLHRDVALKELVLRNVPDPEQATQAKSRVMREGRIAARLMHANAIAVFDVVEDGGVPWLVMEYLPSRSLADVLAERGRLSPGEAAAIGRQIAVALAAAHSSGIVHRDIKPANVLIAEDGTAKITDFGISRAAGDVTVTATGIVAGTPGYLAPEVARGDDADFASDVFSLGATLYHAVEGRPPFGLGENAIAQLYRVSCGEFDPPLLAGPLTPVLQRLLDIDPKARPGMAECAAALAAIRDQVPQAAQGGHAAVGTKTGPRRKIAALAAAVVLLALGGLLVAWLIPADPAEPGAADPPPPASSPTEPGAETTSTSAQEETSAAPSSSVLDRASRLEKAVADYYGLLPANLEEAYALLSDGFKAARASTFGDYQGFWGRMSAVDVSEVQASGDNTVTATVTYTEAGGGTQSERHTYTLVEQDGRWLIDSQTQGG
ncbi:Serine/threonine protein kinase [Amycolatopsis marina]|uniref:non-specific serine/threonine protein kinase n=1 Tax=Amycolatopsis marina TaxID=490629 RepID=A0A1I0ZTH5_9PSEU|nr:serine/threonine-protein kinase [Amycolatopsis marina]SFB28662.1 Serine/threonine protein kinase [Amycolatopsis marina]